MELITLYSEVLQKQLLEKNKNKTIKRTREEWMPFLESESHSITVYAGRGTGKTFNIVSRVLLSEHDCFVFCESNYHKREFWNELARRWDNECLHKNKEIRIFNINDSLSESSLYQLQGKEIIFDEFDSTKFCRYVELHRGLLNQAAHVVCVGSMYDVRRNLSAKLWFRESELSYFIDSQLIDSDSSIEKFIPSSFSSYINQLPPSRYEFI
ncbi:hypothetical protein O0R52_22395 (plasmid) [Bacillus halotolerans]|uniref:Uncharacterized protein n=1 Tax=Bacillus halotolerans TaxID=260554 RepID=A0ABY7I8U1_9BACI|nr:hypothetical protein [Bacillus halotolerans]WAT23535.1 hypothetical protein O0R52_22395 [Bacillus halotolerans]